MLAYYERDEEENSTDKERDRERISGGRFLRKLSGTGLGVLCDKHSVTPAITVGEESYVLIRVVPPRFRSLSGWKSRRFLVYMKFISIAVKKKKG